MTASTALEALTRVTGMLVRDYDVVSSLTELTHAYAALLGEGTAVGLLVAPSSREESQPTLELLASSSHDATQLELYQAQVGEGPCLDAMAVNEDLTVIGNSAFVARWPRVGVALAGSPFNAVHAIPLRWLGRPMGALNAFVVQGRDLSAEERTAARAFTDVASVAIVNARSRAGADDVARGLREALSGRVIIEHAKGVLMHSSGLDPAGAFSLLVRRAHEAGAPVIQTAAEVLTEARSGRHRG